MNGVLSVIKPPGMTSHDAVSFLRRTTGIKKIGHTGTLDPGAAGVLPLCIGKATKIVDFIMDDRKTYICELTLGNRTLTFDKYGEFIFEKDHPYDITYETFNEVLSNFKGQITQVPPSFSAIKIDGKRAYDLARKGQEVEMPKREVYIYDIKVLNFDLPRIMLQIESSKGTYIRSICNDIGEIIGCGAYMSFLVRTQTGNFTLDNSYPLEEITPDNYTTLIKPIDFALNFDSIYINDTYIEKITNGNSIKLENPSKLNEDTLLKVYLNSGMFIGIGKVKNNILHMSKVLI